MKYALALLLAFFSTAALAASIDGSGLLSLLVYVVVIALVFWCFWWFLGYVGLPEPFNKVARVVLGLVALIFVVNVLLSLVGTPMFSFR